MWRDSVSFDHTWSRLIWLSASCRARCRCHPATASMKERKEKDRHYTPVNQCIPRMMPVLFLLRRKSVAYRRRFDFPNFLRRSFSRALRSAEVRGGAVAFGVGVADDDGMVE